MHKKAALWPFCRHKWVFHTAPCCVRLCFSTTIWMTTPVALILSASSDANRFANRIMYPFYEMALTHKLCASHCHLDCGLREIINWQTFKWAGYICNIIHRAQINSGHRLTLHFKQTFFVMRILSSFISRIVNWIQFMIFSRGKELLIF